MNTSNTKAPAPQLLIVDVKREKITRELTIKIIKHNLQVVLWSRLVSAWWTRNGLRLDYRRQQRRSRYRGRRRRTRPLDGTKPAGSLPGVANPRWA
jgi:hypothetical protein